MGSWRPQRSFEGFTELLKGVLRDFRASQGVPGGLWGAKSGLRGFQGNSRDPFKAFKAISRSFRVYPEISGEFQWRPRGFQGHEVSGVFKVVLGSYLRISGEYSLSQER